MLRSLGLGSVAAAANGITISTTTNATPIVATFGAGHGLKTYDRVAITGITGNTGANGEWTLVWTAATTAQLLGSVGNGAHGGTPVVAVICDVTPFMKGHSAVAAIGNTPGAAVFVGTLLVEGSADNSSFATALALGEEAIPAATAGIGITRDVVLSKYMRLRCSAYTSGAANAQLLA